MEPHNTSNSMEIVDNWGNNLLTKMYPLFINKVLTDTVIVCEDGKTVTAHSLVLAASSPMLFVHFRGSAQGQYTLRCPTVPKNIWANVIEFIYSGRVCAQPDQLLPTYNLANKLGLDDLCKVLAVCLDAHSSASNYQRAVPHRERVSLPMPKVGIPRSDSTKNASEMSSAIVASNVMKATSNIIDNGKSVEGEKMDGECDDDYEDEDSLDSDTKDSAKSTKRHECSLCFMSFSRLESLNAHIKNCQGQGPNSANIPTQVNSGKVAFLRNCYRKVRSGTRTFFYCVHCDSTYAAYAGVAQHVKAKHPEVIQYDFRKELKIKRGYDSLEATDKVPKYSKRFTTLMNKTKWNKHSAGFSASWMKKSREKSKKSESSSSSDENEEDEQGKQSGKQEPTGGETDVRKNTHNSGTKLRKKPATNYNEQASDSENGVEKSKQKMIEDKEMTPKDQDGEKVEQPKKKKRKGDHKNEEN